MFQEILTFLCWNAAGTKVIISSIPDQNTYVHQLIANFIWLLFGARVQFVFIVAFLLKTVACCNRKVSQNVLYKKWQNCLHDAKLEDKSGNELNFQSCWSCPSKLTSMIDAALLLASFYSCAFQNQSSGGLGSFEWL